MQVGEGRGERRGREGGEDLSYTMHFSCNGGNVGRVARFRAGSKLKFLK
jgi:hypothetical protein